MSIYEGTHTQQNYRAGVELGREFAQADLAAYAATGTHALELRAEASEALRYGSSRRWAAFKLGIARGYRETIRTLRNGRWGT